VRERLKVLFVTGGDSLERRSSPGSAAHVMAVLPPGWCDAYLVVLEAGQWRLLQGAGLSPAEVAAARFDGCDLTLKSQGVALRFDVVFMAIHGAPAETGHLQALLEWQGVPYVGSGVLASALAMDKATCKRVVAGVTGVQVPPAVCLPAVGAGAVDGEAARVAVADGPGFPCVVKPNAYGSGFGVHLVHDAAALPWALAQVAALGQAAVVEAFIDGRELTVAAVVDDNGIQVLPVAEVFRTDASAELAALGRVGFTDRQSARLQMNPPLAPQALAALQAATREIGQVLQCRDFFRVDYILSPDGGLYFLEVNTIPGMGERSVFTQQLQASGIDEGAFYAGVIERAWKAGSTAPRRAG
jgi:D-alanine-D-alanine ligase